VLSAPTSHNTTAPPVPSAATQLAAFFAAAEHADSQLRHAIELTDEITEHPDRQPAGLARFGVTTKIQYDEAGGPCRPGWHSLDSDWKRRLAECSGHSLAAVRRTAVLTMDLDDHSGAIGVADVTSLHDQFAANLRLHDGLSLSLRRYRLMTRRAPVDLPGYGLHPAAAHRQDPGVLAAGCRAGRPGRRASAGGIGAEAPRTGRAPDWLRARVRPGDLRTCRLEPGEYLDHQADRPGQQRRVLDA
jgi:hypothetical protein